MTTQDALMDFLLPAAVNRIGHVNYSHRRVLIDFDRGNAFNIPTVFAQYTPRVNNNLLEIPSLFARTIVDSENTFIYPIATEHNIRLNCKGFISLIRRVSRFTRPYAVKLQDVPYIMSPWFALNRRGEHLYHFTETHDLTNPHITARTLYISKRMFNSTDPAEVQFSKYLIPAAVKYGMKVVCGEQQNFVFTSIDPKIITNMGYSEGLPDDLFNSVLRNSAIKYSNPDTDPAHVTLSEMF